MPVAQPTQTVDGRPPEFRRYRQLLAMSYMGVLALGGLFLTASVVNELFFAHKEGSPPPSPADLVVCEKKVRQLLDDLVATASRLQSSALEEKNVGGQWSAFEGRWQQQWSQANDQCQFTQLEETGLGADYDRVAAVHRGLPTMVLKYRELMHHFTDEQASELAEMRHALDTSRKRLQKRQRQAAQGKTP